MLKSLVEFDLQDGYVHNWLVAGPQVMPLAPSTEFQPVGLNDEFIQKFFPQKSEINIAPVERGPLTNGKFVIGDYQGEWNYYRCRDDHFVNHSGRQTARSILRSWAYCQIFSPRPQTARLTITSFGPVDVCVNKKPVFQTSQRSDQAQQHAVDVSLVKGENKILARFAGVSTPAFILVLSLHIQGDSLQVHIPTQIPSISRRNQIEAINETLFLDRDVYSAADRIYLCWPDEILNSGQPPYGQDARLQSVSGPIYAQAADIGKPGYQLYLGESATLKQGQYQVVVRPRDWEFYESNIRVTKTLELFVMGKNAFSERPFGSPEERRQEALLTAAYSDNDPFAEVAKMALGYWHDLVPAVLAEAAGRVQRRLADSEIDLLCLLGGLLRFGAHEKFPDEAKNAIGECALNFRYWQDEPGHDLLAFEVESRQILFHTCAILAGRCYPQLVFSSSGLTGEQLCQKAESLAKEWIKARCSFGFSSWDAKDAYEKALAALSHLVDLSTTESVWELASVLIDKILFSIAINSFQGVFGSVQKPAPETIALKSGLLEATAGITRLFWGMGVNNHHTAGRVSLALMEQYTFPPILAEIAVNSPDELWNQELVGPPEAPVKKVTYRTPDGMLSSVQDYHPGERGASEHLWQATFGPESLVFVNHPAFSAETAASSPNFWAGNGSLPRIAQYKDTLVAIYHLPEDAHLQYTHAFAPIKAFDETTQHGNTLFLRKGQGYLALTASQPLEAQKSGPGAHREFRAYGRQVIWLCQMGRAASDGSFADFQEKILAKPPDFDALSVSCQTARGEKLAFAWQGALTINEVEPTRAENLHFDNPYTRAEFPCREMEIKTENYLLRLNFSESEE